MGRSPFETIDQPGVGWLVRLAAWVGREAKPELGLGICGEHGGDPDSIAFFQLAGLDYVSCSPYRVPIARVAAAQSAIAQVALVAGRFSGHESRAACSPFWPPRPRLLALATGVAVGHVERSSYWPNPAPDRSVKPAAGGKVPKARRLASALKRRARGDTYVVCKSNSLRKATRSIRSARRNGWKRAADGAHAEALEEGARRKLTRSTGGWPKRCGFRHIQAAVNTRAATTTAWS